VNPPASRVTDLLSANEVELISCLIAAPNQVVAADWVGCSPTHLRRQLKELRERFEVETNAQLIVVASVSGSVNPAKVLPFRQPLAAAPPPARFGEGATAATPAR
jgi:hypothetical protein